MLTLQTFFISFSRGSIVLGPLQQFNPTTSAPASSKRLQASGNVKPSLVLSSTCGAIVTTAGTVMLVKQTYFILGNCLKIEHIYIISQLFCVLNHCVFKIFVYL